MDVDFRGYRPEWVDALPMPRVLPETIPPLMERIDGRRLVRPFQTTRPPEERQVYRDASWPWGLVCKIFHEHRGQRKRRPCRSLPCGDGRAQIPPAGAWWIRVVPGYFDGTSLHGAGVQSFVSDWRGYSQGVLSDTTGRSSDCMNPLDRGWGTSATTATTTTGRTVRTGRTWVIPGRSTLSVRPVSSAFRALRRRLGFEWRPRAGDESGHGSWKLRGPMFGW